MIEFSGSYEASVDDKGRIVLPAHLKKEMGELALSPMIIEKNLFKECLDIYPEMFWANRVEAFKSSLDQFDEEDDDFLQFFYENFVKVSMAKNGRINFPDAYLKYADVTKNVKIIGMGKSIRIWDLESYEKQKMERSTFLKKFKEKRNKE